MIWSRLLNAIREFGLVLAAIGALVFYGWWKRGEKEEAEDLQDWRDTKERIDEVHRPDDADAATDWLRDRQDKRSGDM